MALSDLLLPEYDHEMATTRRVLVRVPETHFSWTPHDKSMTLGQLAGHIAWLPSWCTKVLETTAVDFEAEDAARVRLEMPASLAALMRAFDSRVIAARALLSTRTDAELLTPWTLAKGDEEVFTMPRISVIRSFVMNHVIHHRGQLTVYLRLREVPLPPIYGPTGEEA